MNSGWEIEYTEHFEQWWHSLDEDQQEAITARVELLEEQGPNLGRPIVAEVLESDVPHLKELRCSKDGSLRVLFVFDPRRVGLLLLGGDKTGQWKQWYREMIPVAERLWREHLAELREEGEIE